MSKSSSASPKKTKGGRKYAILIVMSIVGAVVLKLSFIFFFIGMLPAMVAYIVDHDKHKYIFSTVAALNITGVFPDMVSIYMSGSTFDAVKTKLVDPTVWLVMYGAAGVGWGIVWVSPVIAALCLDGVYKGRVLQLERAQKKLEEEWGAEVVGKVIEAEVTEPAAVNV